MVVGGVLRGPAGNLPVTMNWTHNRSNINVGTFADNKLCPVVNAVIYN